MEELILVLVALTPVLIRAFMGWRTGATLEIRHVLVYAFAFLAAMRWWQPVAMVFSGFITLDMQYLAAAVFVLLLAVAGIIAALAVDLMANFYQSVGENLVDRILGVILGIFSGGILGAAMLAVFCLALPGKWAEFDLSEVPARFDQVPVKVFRSVEKAVNGPAVSDSGRTLLPVLEGSGDSSSVTWR